MGIFKKKKQIGNHALILGIDFKNFSPFDVYRFGAALRDAIRIAGKEITLTMYLSDGTVERMDLNADKADSSSL